MYLRSIYYKIILIIPVVFTIITNTSIFFSPRTINPGTVRGGLMAGFLLIFLLKFYPKSPMNRIMLIFTVYIGLLCFLSSNIGFSFYAYLKFFIASLMLPLGYYFINNHERFLNLSYSFAITLGLFMLNILLSNIFNFGSSDYLPESFYFGGGRVTITKTMMILIITSPMVFANLKGSLKRIYILFIIISLFTTLIGIKRSVILSAISSLGIFMITGVLRSRIFSLTISTLVIAVIFWFFFSDAIGLFTSRWTARGQRVEIEAETLETEARYSETKMVLNAWVDGSIKHKLIGSEMFNDHVFFKSDRMLHTDYMVVINGSGIIGIIFWFMIYIYMIREKEKYWKFCKNDERLIYYHPIFYSILAAQMFMSVSGTIQGIDLRGFILLSLGAIIGTLRGEYVKKMQNILSGNEI